MDIALLGVIVPAIGALVGMTAVIVWRSVRPESLDFNLARITAVGISLLLVPFVFTAVIGSSIFDVSEELDDATRSIVSLRLLDEELESLTDRIEALEGAPGATSGKSVPSVDDITLRVLDKFERLDVDPVLNFRVQRLEDDAVRMEERLRTEIRAAQRDQLNEGDVFKSLAIVVGALLSPSLLIVLALWVLDRRAHRQPTSS